MVKQEHMKRLNLSHNDLSGLMGFLADQSNMFTGALETLTLVDIGLVSNDATRQLTRSVLAGLTGLYELDVSENSGVLADKLLQDI